jgi:phosphate-selective porin OprO/OprP
MKKTILTVIAMVVAFSISGYSQVHKKDVITVPGFSEWRHGIYFWRSEDKQFAGRFDGRAFLNGAYFFENKSEVFSNGTHLRKARFAIKMLMWKNWYTEWDFDFADGAPEVKDMYLGYVGFKNSYTKFGHFKVPYGLEILTSSRYIPFPERYYGALAFKLGRRMAIEHGRWGDNWNVRVALFGQTFDDQKNKTKNETGGGLAARVAAAPINKENMILHIGASAVWDRPDDESWLVDFDAEPETKIGDYEVLKTPKIKNVNHNYRFGFEGAFVYNNFHLQGEYQIVNVYRNNDLSSATFGGGYVYLLWDITGEHRKWDNEQGEFGQLFPNPANKYGTWELGLRYSYLSLSDEDASIYGGVGANYTFGVNWYPNANIVWQLNYTYVQTSEHSKIGEDNFSYIQFMTKFFF